MLYGTYANVIDCNDRLTHEREHHVIQKLNLKILHVTVFFFYILEHSYEEGPKQPRDANM